ncbi:Mitochondrial import inner membrane translocase subunit tim8 [Scheffersomyces spartinae]|uniref:Mitochondrial import inner membrane translocase subunit n=1 Tax=Scheffersomyces spartinae TaxID=45513 RepID=A0A9P7V7P9_9ASCO|nr:Mitochondrial import inner membrane translocase subunit tim8 [Scheffersomyces spartinae]KAG7192633.1 Mitochondrial import inner membrane translocase subunit tim8 [Scheffersomyces spartinae]
MSTFNTELLRDLDESSRQEIAQLIEAENSKSKIQMSISHYTDMCFKKCNANKPISTGNLDSSEEKCLTNCLNRFLDTNIKVVHSLQGKK